MKSSRQANVMFTEMHLEELVKDMKNGSSVMYL